MPITLTRSSFRLRPAQSSWGVVSNMLDGQKERPDASLAFRSITGNAPGSSLFRGPANRRRRLGGIATLATVDAAALVDPAGRRVRRAAFHDRLDLLGVDGFPLQQRGDHRFDDLALVLEDAAGDVVLHVENAPDLGIDLLLRRF